MTGNLEFGQGKKQNLHNPKNQEVFHHIIRMIKILINISPHMMGTTNSDIIHNVGNGPHGKLTF